MVTVTEIKDLPEKSAAELTDEMGIQDAGGDGWSITVQKLVDLLGGLNTLEAMWIEKAAPYTIQVADRGASLKFTASVTATMPARSLVADDYVVLIGASGGDVTVDTTGADTISGGASTNVPDGTALLVFAGGAGEWHSSALPVAVATQSEAEAASANNKVMTPLRSKQQIDARLASQAQAEAGTDNSDLMTALRVAQALVSPKVTTVRDANGNEAIVIASTASAVNELRVVNAATGDAVELEATGDDTNIDVNVAPKGDGVFQVKGEAVAPNTPEYNSCSGAPLVSGATNIISFSHTVGSEAGFVSASIGVLNSSGSTGQFSIRVGINGVFGGSVTADIDDTYWHSMTALTTFTGLTPGTSYTVVVEVTSPGIASATGHAIVVS